MSIIFTNQSNSSLLNSFTLPLFIRVEELFNNMSCLREEVRNITADDVSRKRASYISDAVVLKKKHTFSKYTLRTDRSSIPSCV